MNWLTLGLTIILAAVVTSAFDPKLPYRVTVKSPAGNNNPPVLRLQCKSVEAFDAFDPDETYRVVHNAWEAKANQSSVYIKVENRDLSEHLYHWNNSLHYQADEMNKLMNEIVDDVASNNFIDIIEPRNDTIFGK